MLGKPCLRHQCKLAIDRLPEDALPEALERLRAIDDEQEPEPASLGPEAVRSRLGAIHRELDSLEVALAMMGGPRSLRLSNRDRDRFLAMLDDENTKPSEALLRTVERYKAATEER